MREKKAKSTKRKNARSYEADTFSLQTLRLIAAPNPADDLSTEERAARTGEPFSAELIQHLIEKIKAI
jgi:hypothetical protein